MYSADGTSIGGGRRFLPSFLPALPVIYLLTIRDSFFASHTLKDHPLCDRMHGHSFRVEITVMGDPEPETHNLVANDGELWADWLEAKVEVQGRHLNEMLPATIPSAHGIAAWIHERLALRYKMYEVKVWQENLAASVRRDR